MKTKTKAKKPEPVFRPFIFTPGLTAWAPGDISPDAPVAPAPESILVEAERVTSGDRQARYQAQVTGQTKPAPIVKPMLRQSAAPKLNKTEAAWGDDLRASLPSCPVFEQAITLRLANGCRYTPDFAQTTPDGIPAFYEVKGFMRDDAAVKIKVAAAQFPAWAFWLVWRKAGTWQQQRILA